MSKWFIRNWAAELLKVFRIRGCSMQPLLHEGDYVLAVPLGFRRLKAGRLVVVRHPRYGVIIKRIDAIEDDGTIWLASDNAAGITAQELGRTKKDQLLGSVLLLFRRNSSNSGHPC